MTDTFSLSRRLAAEALGTGILVATVVGSGIMADKLAGGNTALALLGTHPDWRHPRRPDLGPRADLRCPFQSRRIARHGNHRRPPLA